MQLKRLEEIIKELKKQGAKGETEVFIRMGHATGNIAYLDQLEVSTYSSFGIVSPCLILNTELTKPEIVDLEGEFKDFDGSIEEIKEDLRISAQKKFFNNIGIEKVDDTPEFNKMCNRSYLIFNEKGEIYGIKTCGGGSLERDGVKYDFKYVSSDENESQEVMCNWLRPRKLYAHCLSSFNGRSEEWYKKSLVDKLASLGWETKDGRLINLGW